MRIKEVKVYQFSELSDTAKGRAKDDFAADMGYSWSAEWLASLKSLAEHFDAKLSNWSIDWFAGSHSSADFALPDDMSEEEIGERIGRLGTYNAETLSGNGDCVLTGFCMDEDAIDGLRIAWHEGERSLDSLLQAAFRSLLKAAQADCEDQYSDERFAEMCNANDYEFYENGELA